MQDTALQEFIKRHSGSTCDALEISVFNSETASVRIHEGSVDEISSDVRTTLGVKAFIGSAWGYAYTENTSDEALLQALRMACENAAIAPDDPHDKPIMLDASSVSHAEILRRSSPQEYIDLSLYAERISRHAHPKIFGLSECGFSAHTSSYAFYSNNGNIAAFSQVGEQVYVGALARLGDTDRIVNPYRDVFSSGQHITPQHLDVLASWISTETALRLKNADISSGIKNIILHPAATRTLMRRFESLFFADAVLHHMSAIAGKLGSHIASELVTLIDNPQSGPAPRNIDADGFCANPVVLIDRGICVNYLHNAYTARRMNLQNNARSIREPRLARAIGSSHLQMVPGNLSHEEIISRLGSGILVTEITGASASPISGDFSYGANGHVFENGILTGFADQFTISGNILDLFKNIVFVGNRLEFEAPGLWGSCGMPYLAVTDVMVSA